MSTRSPDDDHTSAVVIAFTHDELNILYRLAIADAHGDLPCGVLQPPHDSHVEASLSAAGKIDAALTVAERVARERREGETA